MIGATGVGNPNSQINVSYDELVMTARWAFTYICSFWRMGRLRGSRKFKISKTEQKADRNAGVHRFTQQLKQSATHADLLDLHIVRSSGTYEPSFVRRQALRRHIR
jgi:hypothetical protein